MKPSWRALTATETANRNTDDSYSDVVEKTPEQAERDDAAIAENRRINLQSELSDMVKKFAPRNWDMTGRIKEMAERWGGDVEEITKQANRMAGTETTAQG